MKTFWNLCTLELCLTNRWLERKLQILKKNLFLFIYRVEGGELFDKVVSIDKYDEITGKLLFFQMATAIKVSFPMVYVINNITKMYEVHKCVQELRICDLFQFPVQNQHDLRKKFFVNFSRLIFFLFSNLFI